MINRELKLSLNQHTHTKKQVLQINETLPYSNSIVPFFGWKKIKILLMITKKVLIRGHQKRVFPSTLKGNLTKRLCQIQHSSFTKNKYSYSILISFFSSRPKLFLSRQVSQKTQVGTAFQWCLLPLECLCVHQQHKASYILPGITHWTSKNTQKHWSVIKVWD